MFGAEFGPQVFWHRGKGFSPQEVHEILVTQKFVECRHDEDQFRIANLGFPYQQLLPLALAPVCIHQTLGAGQPFPCSATTGVTLLASEASLVNEAFHRANGHLVELFGLVGFEQFTLCLHTVRLGDVHCDAERNSPAGSRVQQAFFPSVLQGDQTRDHCVINIQLSPNFDIAVALLP